MNSIMQKFEKNIISKSRSTRKHITEFHKITKDVKKQVSLDIKQVTVTQIFDQVVFMGPEQIVSKLSNEMKATISGLFQSADNPSNFTSTFKVSLPKLFADLRLAKTGTIWTTKLMQAQVMDYLCILGFGFGGNRYLVLVLVLVLVLIITFQVI